MPNFKVKKSVYTDKIRMSGRSALTPNNYYIPYQIVLPLVIESSLKEHYYFIRFAAVLGLTI